MKTYQIHFPSSFEFSSVIIHARSKNEAIAKLNRIAPYSVVLISLIKEI